MEVTALLLNTETTQAMAKILADTQKRHWKITLQSVRQGQSGSNLRESAVVVDDFQAENVVLVLPDCTACECARSLPEILLHSKLWTTAKTAGRQISGYTWQLSGTQYWYMADDSRQSSVLIFGGEIHPGILDTLRLHTVYLLNRWVGVENLSDLARTVVAFTRFCEAAKMVSFEDALVRNRLVSG